MDYRYLGTTGVLNEAEPTPSWQGRPVSPVRPARSRDRKKKPIWGGRPVPRAICKLVPESLAREDRVFPIGEDGETLRLAAVNHDDVALADKLSFVVSRPVRLIAASREEVDGLIREYFEDESG